MATTKVPPALVDARIGACRVWPHASHAILSMVPVPTPGLARQSGGHIAVDQYWRLYYDPAVLEQRQPAQNIQSVLHEVMHLLARHHRRAGTLVPPQDKAAWLRWNYAADMAVWSVLRHNGMPVPDTAVTPDRFGLRWDLSAEQYFKLLQEQAQQEQQQQQQAQQQAAQDEECDDEQESDDDSQGQAQDADGSDDAGEPGGEPGDEGAEGGEAGCDAGEESAAGHPDGSAAPESGDADGEVGAGASEQPTAGGDGGDGTQDAADQSAGDDAGGADAQPQPGIGGGSCADGQQRSWELPPPDAQPGQAEQPEAVEQWQEDQLIHNVAERAKAKGYGTSPGWQQIVADCTEPKLSPERLLARVITRATGRLMSGSGKFSFRRPPRRPSLGGVLMPTNYRPVPRILVVIDTSGSMSEAEIALGCGLVSRCLHQLSLRDGVHVICGDTTVNFDAVVQNPRDIKVRGRGGTDMAAIVEHAAKKRPHERPELIIVVTDGETPWPEHRVSMPVIAAIVRDDWEPVFYPVPEWMTSVHLA